jgi:hypothetical protein
VNRQRREDTSLKLKARGLEESWSQFRKCTCRLVIVTLSVSRWALVNCVCLPRLARDFDVRCPKLAVPASSFAQFGNALEHYLQGAFLLITEHGVMVCLRKRRSSKVNLPLPAKEEG